MPSSMRAHVPLHCSELLLQPARRHWIPEHGMFAIVPLADMVFARNR